MKTFVKGIDEAVFYSLYIYRYSPWNKLLWITVTPCYEARYILNKTELEKLEKFTTKLNCKFN